MEIKKKLFLTFIKHWKMFEKIILYSFFMMKSNLFLMKCIFLRKMWAGSIQEETF